MGDDLHDDGDARRELSLYRGLLELGARDEIEPFLEEALELMVALTSARKGYIEISAEDGDDEPRFWMAHGCYDEEVDAIRAAFSRGIIAEAIATGRTILVDSAIDHPRYKQLESVARNLTGPVLCAPLGTPPLGVIYLQDRDRKGGFTEEHRLTIERCARHLSIFADRLMARQDQRDRSDATRPFREKLRCDGLIGRSEALARVIEQAGSVAPLNVSVLITGPSGTGKTQIARLIHENSKRAAGPFIEQNCASLKPELSENELFGAMPGSHSEARQRIRGRVDAAEGGTLFLDEIGELPSGAQAALLQLLQSKEYRPLGSNALLRANVRVIAATNADLRAMIEDKTFREDLYYRLNVITIRMPPLVDRREDIPLIAAHLCDRFCEENELPRLRLSAAALRTLSAADWPGNVRELQNTVQAAAIRAAGQGAVEIDHRHLLDNTAPSSDRPQTLDEQVRDFTRKVVERTWRAHDFNATQAAKDLGMSRSNFYNLLNSFGLRRP